LSHHIKNILQGLRSGNEILKMGLTDKNERLIQQGWRVAEKSQAKIYDLVMDMLSYSKEREPAVEPTLINEVVGDIVELMDARAKELGVQLGVKLDEHLPTIQVDPEGLHRAVLNILGNALDAVEGRPSPQVTIATRLEPGGGHWARITVTDNGSGIPPEKLNDIFKPFVSTKGAKGTGLGLAVSRKILREHGGDITVQSHVNKGSKFILRIPIKSPLSQDPSITGADMPILPPEAD
jgi:signal transduction histidine kinase